MRVDKWIWAVRMTKTRTLAAKLCDQGKVQINDQKAKGSKPLKIGDIVTVDNKKLMIYQVISFIPKRVGAEAAQHHYDDLSPEVELEASVNQAEATARRPRGEGRPTKKDWRAIKSAKENY